MDILLFFLFLHCKQDSLPTMISNVPCQSYETTSGRPLNSGFQFSDPNSVSVVLVDTTELVVHENEHTKRDDRE